MFICLCINVSLLKLGAPAFTASHCIGILLQKPSATVTSYERSLQTTFDVVILLLSLLRQMECCLEKGSTFLNDRFFRGVSLRVSLVRLFLFFHTISYVAIHNWLWLFFFLHFPSPDLALRPPVLMPCCTPFYLFHYTLSPFFLLLLWNNLFQQSNDLIKHM